MTNTNSTLTEWEKATCSRCGGSGQYAAGIDRYSTASHGADGSELRRLWIAKVTADALRFDANCFGCQECEKGH